MPRTSVKSPDAFRTISEAADALDLPQHVLRFWETRFSQIKPMKRSGGRRYYRPTDIALLQGIRHLLYEEGYTIKGVQRILREQGIAHVAGLGSSRAALKTGSMPTPSATAAATPALEGPAVATQPPVPAQPAPIVAPVSPAQPPAVPQSTVPQSTVPLPEAQSHAPQATHAAQASTIRQEAPYQPPAGIEPAAPAQPSPSPVAQGLDTPSALTRPVTLHPPVSAPAAAPTSGPTQPASQPHELPTFPPLGVLGNSPSSTLQFVPDVEPAPAPASSVPGAAEHLPPIQQPVVAADTPVARPAAVQAPAAPAADGQPRLSSQDTETLVQALRTLLDCKAILDSARRPTPNPSSASS